jgi:hypothetical protein
MEGSIHFTPPFSHFPPSFIHSRTAHVVKQSIIVIINHDGAPSSLTFETKLLPLARGSGRAKPLAGHVGKGAPSSSTSSSIVCRLCLLCRVEIIFFPPSLPSHPPHTSTLSWPWLGYHSIIITHHRITNNNIIIIMRTYIYIIMMLPTLVQSTNKRGTCHDKVVVGHATRDGDYQHLTM